MTRFDNHGYIKISKQVALEGPSWRDDENCKNKKISHTYIREQKKKKDVFAICLRVKYNTT